jgi:hypothetical protein
MACSSVQTTSHLWLTRLLTILLIPLGLLCAQPAAPMDKATAIQELKKLGLDYHVEDGSIYQTGGNKEHWKSLEPLREPLRVLQPRLLSLGCLDRISDFSVLTSFQSLEELLMTTVFKMTDTDALAGHSKLRVIYLNGCKTLGGANALLGISKLANLESLTLSDCDRMDDTDLLSKLTKLRHLKMYTWYGLRRATALQGVSALTGLERLDLGNCWNLKDLNYLASLQNLTYLSLRSTRGLNGKGALRGLASLVKLEELDLYGSSLKDTDSLAPLVGLRRLNLEYNAGLSRKDSIRGISALPRLEELNLHGCYKLEPADVKWLGEQLGPKCNIIQR